MNELPIGGVRLIPGEVPIKFLPAKLSASINGGRTRNVYDFTRSYFRHQSVSQNFYLFVIFQNPINSKFLPLSMALCTISEVHLSERVGPPAKHCMISESDVRAS